MVSAQGRCKYTWVGLCKDGVLKLQCFFFFFFFLREDFLRDLRHEWNDLQEVPKPWSKYQIRKRRRLQKLRDAANSCADVLYYLGAYFSQPPQFFKTNNIALTLFSVAGRQKPGSVIRSYLLERNIDLVVPTIAPNFGKAPRLGWEREVLDKLDVHSFACACTVQLCVLPVLAAFPILLGLIQIKVTS